MVRLKSAFSFYGESGERLSSTVGSLHCSVKAKVVGSIPTSTVSP